MDDCLGRRLLHGKLQLPVAHLVCNSTPPAGGKPSLMTFREVETLFHEFGHGLQHMLTTVDYADAAGINGVEWDAVELPSQFMENWCYHRPTLLGLSAHYETGAAAARRAVREDLRGPHVSGRLAMLRQLLFGMTDMALHGSYSPDLGRVGLRRAAADQRTDLGAAAVARGPLALRVHAHFLRRLRGRLLQLQMGRGAERRRLQRVSKRPGWRTSRPSPASAAVSATRSWPKAAAAIRWRSSKTSAAASPVPQALLRHNGLA